MPLDLQLFGSKVRRYREQFKLSTGDVSAATGLTTQKVTRFENGDEAPTGDEVLILADFFKCDYKFFVSNEQLAPIDQTDALFRRHGDQFSPKDRWALQEVLFLADCEAFLQVALEKTFVDFSFWKRGDYKKGHGESAAKELRTALGYDNEAVPSDVFYDFRRLGIHIFRRKLDNSNVSGLFVKHPTAGPCLLINYNEDVYRQRFTVSHEAGHAILDTDDDFVVSFLKSREPNDLVEVRANAFASHFLLPRQIFKKLVRPNPSDEQFIEWSNGLKVNPETLSIALSDAQMIDESAQQRYRQLRIPKHEKTDPELPPSLSLASRERKEHLLERGLSDYYVNLCIDAYGKGIVSAGRLTDMFLVSTQQEAADILAFFGHSLSYDS